MEMHVRWVRKHVPTGNDVAVLGPADAETRPMIALSVSRPEAVDLNDELDGKLTPRAAAFDLMVGILGAAGATVDGIEVSEAPGQSAQARLQLSSPRGQTEIRVEVGPVLALSVRIGKPLQVSDRLVAAMTPPAARPATNPATVNAPSEQAPVSSDAADDDASLEAPTPGAVSEVPEQFRRAFDDAP
ncbi:MAG: bifunctional nuclease family protein [Chloroflexi bacterium]|nr:bifunctional nuclease family protein [Chloroflexota bacterium]